MFELCLSLSLPAINQNERAIPSLPLNSTVYLYGVLSGAESIAVTSTTVMMKTLTIKRFSHFAGATVKDLQQLLQTLIDSPAFTTNMGWVFHFDEIEKAIAYTSSGSTKAVLIHNFCFSEQ